MREAVAQNKGAQNGDVAVLPIGYNQALEGVARGDWTPTEMRVWAAVMGCTEHGRSHALFTNKTLGAMIKRSPGWVGQVVKRMAKRNMLWLSRGHCKRGEYCLRPTDCSLWEEREPVVRKKAAPKPRGEQRSAKGQQPAIPPSKPAKKTQQHMIEDIRESAFVLFYFGNADPPRKEDGQAKAHALALGLPLLKKYQDYPRKEGRLMARKAFDTKLNWFKAQDKKRVKQGKHKMYTLKNVLEILEQGVFDAGLYDRELNYVKHPATFFKSI